jgi:DNA end-binding protein Ku
MAPRANWKGYLRLSLVSCPIALYQRLPSERRFDSTTSTPKPVIQFECAESMKRPAKKWTMMTLSVGMKSAKGNTSRSQTKNLMPLPRMHPHHRYRHVRSKKRDRPNLQHSALLHRPRRKVGIDAFAVIRDVIEATDKVALGRVVLTSREHVIALEPRAKD